MKKIFTLCVVLCLSYLSMGATNLKHEFRATWLTTAWGNDWPKTKVTNDATRKQQQDSLIAIFDRLQAGNMNAVCFQVRGRSDAFYQSSYEPWAAELAGARGKDPGYDPLAFAIEEAHKRGLELHAWVNPFRVTSSGTLSTSDKVWLNAGQWIIQYNNGSFSGQIIDPGYPEAREYVLNVLMEIVNNYDIDGIVMDDYFYPYGGTTTEDAASKALHKPANVVDVNKDGKTDDDWRRSNVDVFLKEFYNRIQTTKPWVRLGMGTFGIWTTQAKVAQAYGIALPSGISGLDDYDEQACNPVEWVKNGYVDYINPQLYWPTTSTGQNYNKLCQWWAKDVCEHFSNQLTNGKKVHFFSSQSISSNSAVSEIQAEIDANRNNLSSGSTGSVFFDTDAYLTMDKDLMTSRFATNALTPPMDWKSNTALVAPTNLTVSGSTLTWQHATAERFTVYAYPKGIGVNTATSNPQYLQAVVYDKSFNTSSLGSLDDITIAVYTYDRYGVEHGVALYNADPNATDDPEPDPEPEPSNAITWELNGGEVNIKTVEVPTNAELWEALKDYYQIFYSQSRADQPISAVSTFMTKACSLMTDAASEYKWLGDYIMSVAAEQGYTLTDDPTADGMEALWRWHVHSFLNCNQHTSWPHTADFSTAGQPSQWGFAYQIAHGAVLMPTYVTSAFTLPTPTHPSGHDFLGWYDNAEFTGSPLTTIPAGWTGTLYAKWNIIDPTWQILYTSTDGNIVTPYATDVFGANIVSNTYEDGQGVITFDGPVMNIGDEAFYNRSSLTSITIPNSVTSIGYAAFGRCSGLTSITIPNSVTSIGERAFYGCSGLTSIVVDGGNTTYDSREKCNAIIETATNTLIAGCQNTTIPNSVTSIGSAAFEGCTSLTSVTIPNSVTNIGELAFHDCSSLDTIHVEATTPPALADSTVFKNTPSPTCYIPCGTLAAYEASDWANYMGEFVEVCPTVVKAKVPASWEDDVITVWVWTDGAGTEYPTTKEGDWYIYTHSDAEEFNIIFKSGTGWKDMVYFQTQTEDITGITSNTCLRILSKTNTKATYTIVDCNIVDDTEYFITYTSTDGKIVTPNATDVFGANIVSNTYKNGVGTITFDGPVTSIGDWAFFYCDGLRSITLPNSVTNIGCQAFFGCSSLTTVSLPNSVTTIVEYAFQNCTSLTQINIPSNVTYIGKGAFAGTSNVETIVVSSENEVYDSRNNCNAIIETTSNKLISGCKNSIIPESVSTIGEMSFASCKSMKNINLPNSINSIEVCAFEFCSGLTSITLPNSVESIGSYAFNCSSLTSIKCEVATPPILGDTVFGVTPLSLCYIPCGALAAYQASDWASQVGSFMEDCVEGQQIYYTSNNDSIVTPNRADVFGANIVSNTYENGQGVITFDGPVTSIGIQAFHSCSNLTSINIPETVTSIGRTAFYNCSNLTSINIPEAVTSIGQSAFNGCSNIASINIPEAVTSIGPSAFFICSSLTSINIPDAVTSIERSTFYGCSSLTSINIPKAVTSIGEMAFCYCSGLTSIRIPNSVTSIGNSAFSSCSSLDTIHIEAITPPTLGEKAITSSPTCYIPCGTLSAYQASGWAQYVSEFVEDCPKITYELNGGVTNDYGWMSKDDMYHDLLVDINAIIPTTVVDVDTVTLAYDKTKNIQKGIPTYWWDDLSLLLTHSDFRSKWGWLINYMDSACASESKYLPSTSSVYLRYNLSAFFFEKEYTSWPQTPDYSKYGLYPYYQPAWQHAYDNPTNPTEEFILNAPYREGYTFAGWYTNADLSGEKITIVEAETNDTLYAKWIENSLVESTWKVLYTSTNGGIVAPNAIDVFGANIVSNTYENGVGTITFDGPVTSIGTEAFHDCLTLKSITIPNSVNSIGVQAFRDCSAIDSLTIPENVNSISGWAFMDCSSLLSIVVAQENMTYDSRENCNAIIETATNTLIVGCKKTIIPNGVAIIGEHAFRISSLAFITIPNSVTNIERLAFCGSSIDTIYVEATNPPALADSTVFMYTPSPICVIPCGTLAAYEVSDWASQVGGFVEDCVEGQQIYYTSTNDSIVTPYNVNAFDANMVSNIYENGVGTITFDAPLTRIGTEAFRGCSSLTSITIPSSVKNIGIRAFQSCHSLSFIEIPDGITTIGTRAFNDCYALTAINIPNSVTEIKASAFRFCTALTSITLPTSITNINDYTFFGCSTLVSINIPHTVSRIGSEAFRECTNLTSITIPENVTNIGSTAFRDCSKLDSIIIQASTPPTLGEKAITSSPTCYIPCGTLAAYEASDWASQVSEFIEEDCPEPIDPTWQLLYTSTDGNIVEPYATDVFGANIVSNTYENGQGVITFDGPITQIDSYAFYGSTVDSIILPNTITSIGHCAFYLSSLSSITIPESVQTIKSSAFSCCCSLKTLIIEEGVTAIENEAFYHCSSLTSINLPNSIISIGDLAFNDCNSLAFVYIGNNLKHLGENVFESNPSLTSITWNAISGPDSQWRFEPFSDVPVSSFTFGNDVVRIPDLLCSGLCEVTSIIIPNSVDSIGYGAFERCYSLTSITIPNSVTNIGDNAFYACSSITSITIPENVAFIGANAFSECTSLESIIWNAIRCDGAPFYDLRSQVKSFTLGNAVEHIPGYLCYSMSSLCEISIPESVRSIGEQAFAWCTSLTSIEIPANIQNIGEKAFSSNSPIDTIYIRATTPPTLGTEVFFDGYYTPPLSICYIPCGTLADYQSSDWVNQVSEFVEDGCIDPTWQITYTSTDGKIVTPYATDVFGANIVSNTYKDGVGTITFDGPVTSIGNGAFHGCQRLTYITIPKSVKSIGEYAFSECSYLSSITIPDSVTRIGDWAFSFCMTLTSVTIHDSVTSIGEGAFWHCNGLTSITIPSSVTNIGYGVFGYCYNLASLVIAEGNTIYDSRDNCNAIIESTTNTLISGCQNTIILNNVTSIGAEAFYGCSSLTSIILPNSVTNIGDQAFVHCSRLDSITLPNSVTSIGNWAFSGCSKLNTIHVEATTPPVLGYTVFEGTPAPVCVIPCGTLADYEASDWASQVGEFVEDCVEGQQIYYTSTDGNIVTPYATDVFGANIVSNTYEDGQGVITFDGPVTSIGDRAFYGCSGLTSITIPNSVKSIGNYAFCGCSSLTSITIPNSVTSIGDYAFYGCSSLTFIIIPNSVTSIGRGAFAWCSGLTSIVVDVENTTYDSRENCNAIIETATNTLITGCQNTIIPNSVTSIGEWAFYGCSGLTSITIGNSVTIIGELAFYNCYGLKSVTLGNSITSIGNGAFRNCSSLTSITIPNSVTSIGEWAFYGCSGLTSITIGNSVTSIGENAFERCSALTSITIPNSVTSIGDYAFYECYKLKTLHIEAITPPTLGTNAFTSSPTCYIPCGTLAAYEASDWASQVGEFVEEGCAPIQMCGDDLYWEYADGVLTITGTGDMYDYAADTDVPWYDVRGNIKTVSLPNAMTKIGQNAFYKCTAMTSINMPTSLTAIGEKAFAQDTKLACEIILPASMTTIASRAFFNCQAVTAFHIEATTPPTIPNDAFERTTAPIHVPCGYGHVYGKHTQWGMLNLEMCELLQDNVYYYPINGHTARAVTYHSNPTDTIVIPSAVVIDGVPRTVTEVADFAFTDCDDLPAIYFSEGLEYIGERAFVRCYGLHGTIVLPATLETIGERAFSYCDNVEKYILQAMTPPALANDVFTGSNSKALFYISCEAMDDYKVATNWSSLKSRLRDACLNIYHYNTALGANGVHTTEDTLVASIYYRRQFTTSRWETLYLPFEVDRVTVLEDGVEYDLNAWSIFSGGHYYLAKPYGTENKEVVFGFTQVVDAHTPYIIQFKEPYFHDKMITFHGKESWNKLNTSFEALPISFEMQMAGNTTLQDQILDQPVYMLRASSNFLLQNTTTTLHPFECYVMPYATSSSAPTRMTVRLRGDVTTAIESMNQEKTNVQKIFLDGQLFIIRDGKIYTTVGQEVK